MSFENNVLVMIAATVSTDSTSVTVYEAAAPMRNPPPTGGRLVLTDNIHNPSKIEIVRYSGATINGNGTITLTGLQRAQEGSTRQNFVHGHMAYQPLTAGDASKWEDAAERYLEREDLIDSVPDALDSKTDKNDPRLSDAREWSAPTVSQSEAEGGDSTARRAWTVQRVWQAIAAWWNRYASAIGKAMAQAADAAAARSVISAAADDDPRIINGQTAYGWGNHASAGYALASRSISAGAGLTGGGNLTANRTLSVNFGTSAGTVAQGNDSRINNGQTAYSWGDYRQFGLGGINSVTVPNLPPTGPTTFYDLSSSGGGLPGVGGHSDRSGVLRMGGQGGTHNSWLQITNAGLYFSWAYNATEIPTFLRAWSSSDFTQSHINNWNTAYGWGNHATAGYALAARTISAGTGLTGGGNLTANRTLSVNFGTAAGTVAEGNDSRINNGQTAYSWGNHASAGYVSTSGNQTISGTKSFSGVLRATATTNSTSTDSGALRSSGGLGVALNIYAGGNITAYSDERRKTNWRSVTDNFVEKLAKVKSGIYDRTDIKETQAGVSAQSLQKVLPESVIEGDDGFLSVVYGNAAMVSAVELAKELVTVKRELKALREAVGVLAK